MTNPHPGPCTAACGPIEQLEQEGHPLRHLSGITPAPADTTEAAAARPIAWYLLQLAYHEDPAHWVDRMPIILNEGTPYQEPFGITRALEWGERLAR